MRYCIIMLNFSLNYNMLVTRSGKSYQRITKEIKSPFLVEYAKSHVSKCKNGCCPGNKSSIDMANRLIGKGNDHFSTNITKGTLRIGIIKKRIS